MPELTEIAVIVGATAHIVLMCRNALGYRILRDKSKPLGIDLPVPRASIVPVVMRNLYLAAFFASVSLIFREEIVSTALGAAMGVGMVGYLKLDNRGVTDQKILDGRKTVCRHLNVE